MLILNLKPNIKAKVKRALVTATRETFDRDIVPLAKQLSPRGSHLRPDQPSHNAESITARVKATASGFRATLFTQSGHGGYLERGTSRQAAQPYLRPALVQGVPKLFTRIRAEVAALK